MRCIRYLHFANILLGVFISLSGASILLEIVGGGTSVPENSTVTILCTINPYGMRMSWLVDNVIYADCLGGSCGPFLSVPEKYTYYFNESEGKFELTIPLVNSSHAQKEFACDDGSARKTLNFSVIEPVKDTNDGDIPYECPCWLIPMIYFLSCWVLMLQVSSVVFIHYIVKLDNERLSRKALPWCNRVMFFFGCLPGIGIFFCIPLLIWKCKQAKRLGCRFFEPVLGWFPILGICIFAFEIKCVLKSRWCGIMIFGWFLATACQVPMAIRCFVDGIPINVCYIFGVLYMIPAWMIFTVVSVYYHTIVGILTYCKNCENYYKSSDLGFCFYCNRYMCNKCTDDHKHRCREAVQLHDGNNIKLTRSTNNTGHDAELSRLELQTQFAANNATQDPVLGTKINEEHQTVCYRPTQDNESVMKCHVCGWFMCCVRCFEIHLMIFDWMKLSLKHGYIYNDNESRLELKNKTDHPKCYMCLAKKIATSSHSATCHCLVCKLPLCEACVKKHIASKHDIGKETACKKQIETQIHDNRKRLPKVCDICPSKQKLDGMACCSLCKECFCKEDCFMMHFNIVHTLPKKQTTVSGNDDDKCSVENCTGIITYICLHCNTYVCVKHASSCHKEADCRKSRKCPDVDSRIFCTICNVNGKNVIANYYHLRFDIFLCKTCMETSRELNNCVLDHATNFFADIKMENNNDDHVLPFENLKRWEIIDIVSSFPVIGGLPLFCGK